MTTQLITAAHVPLEAALDAARRGWSVIPVRIDKKPCLPGWKDSQSVPADADTLVRWHGSYSPAGWAIVGGAVSNTIVLDFDGQAGRDTLERLGLEPHVQTGSGGFHVYVTHPGVRVKTLNSKSKRALGQEFPGMDIRADGGYAIFAGRNQVGEYLALRPFDPIEFEDLPGELQQVLLGAEPVADIHEVPAPTEPTRACVPLDDDILIELVETALERTRIDGRNDTGLSSNCCACRASAVAAHTQPVKRKGSQVRFNKDYAEKVYESFRDGRPIAPSGVRDTWAHSDAVTVAAACFIGLLPTQAPPDDVEAEIAHVIGLLKFLAILSMHAINPPGHNYRPFIESLSGRSAGEADDEVLAAMLALACDERAIGEAIAKLFHR